MAVPRAKGKVLTGRGQPRVARDLTGAMAICYQGCMKRPADMREKVELEGSVERGHDAWLRETVARGLAQSRGRERMIPA